MVQELLALSEATQVFEQIPLVAISKMRGVDWSIIMVGAPLTPTCISVQAVHTQDWRYGSNTTVVC